METTSLFIQKVGVVISGTVGHVTMSDARKAPPVDVKKIIRNLAIQAVFTICCLGIQSFDNF